MGYSIEALSESTVHKWEEFNNRSPEGTLFHSIRWKNILEDTLNLRLRYYLIFEDQRVIGICPFIERSTGIFRGLASLPYSEFTNIVLEKPFDPGHFNEILSLFAEDNAFLHITTYDPNLIDRIQHDSFIIENSGNMMLDLKQRPPESIWSNFSRNMRYNIQIFNKKGFQIREARQHADVETFYRYYAENMAHIQGKVLPFSFFQKLRDSFPSTELRITILANDDVTAGGSLAILDPARRVAYYEYLALNRELPNRYTPTYPIYWDLVNWAQDSGCEKLSFGRQSLDPGNPRYQCKTKFGAEYAPISSRFVVLSKTVSLLYRLRRMLPKRT